MENNCCWYVICVKQNASVAKLQSIYIIYSNKYIIVLFIGHSTIWSSIVSGQYESMVKQFWRIPINLTHNRTGSPWKRRIHTSIHKCFLVIVGLSPTKYSIKFASHVYNIYVHTYRHSPFYSSNQTLAECLKCKHYNSLVLAFEVKVKYKLNIYR